MGAEADAVCGRRVSGTVRGLCVPYKVNAPQDFRCPREDFRCPRVKFAATRQ